MLQSPTKARGYKRLAGTEGAPSKNSTFEMSERVENGDAVTAIAASAFEDGEDSSSSLESLIDSGGTIDDGSSVAVTAATRLLPFDDESDSDTAELVQGSTNIGGGKKKKKEQQKMPQESFLSITLQIFFPFLIAGMGMVGAGLVLDVVQHWVSLCLSICLPAYRNIQG